jgi:4-amino-4-deoxy-L-arabinose transferase-like glycosyltransferase
MIFKKHWLFAVLLLAIGSLLSYKLLTSPRPLFDWDESLYVQNGIEMLETNSYLVPLWQGKAWLDKPPLSPLLFGLAAKIAPIPVEISTRLFTLSLSLVALGLVYALYYKVTQSSFVATLTAAITAFLPIFTQRMQVVSLDPTLLIGWLGFFLFSEKPVISTLFLFLSVQSKSLLGFYPLALYISFQLFLLLTKQLKQADFKKIFIICLGQGALLLLWYFVAFGVYGEAF